MEWSAPSRDPKGDIEMAIHRMRDDRKTICGRDVTWSKTPLLVEGDGVIATCRGCLGLNRRNAKSNPTPQWWGDCARCHRPYSDPGFPDLIISDEAWRQISPTGGDGGLLCPSCIIGALTELGIETEATFCSGPLAGQVVCFGGAPPEASEEPDNDDCQFGEPGCECGIGPSSHRPVAPVEPEGGERP